MRALTGTKSADGRPQLVYYSIGVNGFMGGVFGKGLDENIRLAYEWLIENYNEGDEIFIFGFGRGAFTARSLPGLVALEGILKAGSPIGIAELFSRYQKEGNEESIWTLKDKEAAGDANKLTDQERWSLKYSQPTKVKVVGVWDTVGSVGLAAGDIPESVDPNLITSRQVYSFQSRTAITRLQLTSTVATLLPPFGQSAIA